MQDALHAKIKELLDQHRILTIATLRPDGWPQATTVGYVNDGETIYFLCARDSQKAANIARDNRVSVTIDHDTPDFLAITGLSMGARAILVTDTTEAAHVISLMPGKYPPDTTLPVKMPEPGDVNIYRLEPKVISVLDYSKGFGHTDLVTF